MYLSELSAKYNVPIRHIKEFFDKHNIPTLSYAHIDSKAIKLFEKNLNGIRENILIENLQKEKLDGPKILGRIELPFGKHRTKTPLTYRKSPGNKSEGFSYQSKREFKPLLSIGKLLFFDYRKNKFGIIKEIKNTTNFDPAKVHVYENGLSTSRSLFDGDIVAFTLTKDHKGFIATNLIKISEVKFQEIDPFLPFISAKDLANVDGFPSGSSWQSLDDTTKNKMIKFFLGKKDSDAWYYLLKIANETDIDTYINQHRNSLSDSEKVEYLKRAFSKKLLEIAVADWQTKESKELIALADLAENKVDNLPMSENFWGCISEAEFTFDENWKLYSAFKDVRILQKALDTISFQHFSSVPRLKTVSEVILQNDYWWQVVKTKFEEDVRSLAASRVIEIYHDLKPFSLISNDEQLIELLEGKTLSVYELENLLTCLTTVPSRTSLKKLILSVGRHLSTWKLNELIKTHAEQTNVATTLIDGFMELYSDVYEIDGLISTIKSAGGTVLLNYLITSHCKKLSIVDAVKLLKLAYEANNTEAQKVGFANIKIDSESKLNDLIEELNTLKLSKAVLDANKPLTAFITFIKAEGVPAISQDIYSYINSHAGIAQCFLIKNLIYKTYKKKITFQQLTSVINSIQWTEISAILVQAFVTANNHSEKFLLETLNEVFKNHFQVLLSKNFTPDSFLETFSIKNIVPRCNGRKHYDAELWRGNGKTRWYYERSVTIKNKGNVVDYCEGRPWKKEPLWNRATNQPTAEHYEFYWCRGSYCAQRNDTLDLNEPFYKWTVIEISTILNITLEKLTIVALTGWINRMNEIVERLYCRSCNEVLRPYPFQPRTLGIYGVPMFQCVNDQCEMHKQPIRFTHCLNGKCHEILDSRDCEKCCGTGLICNHCGTKCPRCVGYDAGVKVQQTW